jgi:hypothetical protein
MGTELIYYIYISTFPLYVYNYYHHYYYCTIGEVSGVLCTIGQRELGKILGRIIFGGKFHKTKRANTSAI